MKNEWLGISCGRCNKGFTLAETLAAMLFMAIVIPVAVQGLTIANRAGVVAERKRVAAQLADRLLTETVLTEDWRNGALEGDFGADRPLYRWVLKTTEWSEDAMRTVSVTVFFKAQEREYSVSLSTVVEESTG